MDSGIGAEASAVVCVKFSKKEGHGKQLGAKTTNQRNISNYDPKRELTDGTKQIQGMMAKVLFLSLHSVIQEFLEAEMAAAMDLRRAGA
jgi:hypothetical protein